MPSKLVKEIDRLLAVYIISQTDLSTPVGLIEKFPAIFKLLKIIKDDD